MYLPVERYRKVFLLNTLHEIPDRTSFIGQVAAVMERGGEVIIGELMPTHNYKTHFGCDKPLIGEAELTMLMTTAGFTFEQKIINPGTPRRKHNPYYLFRFSKN